MTPAPLQLTALEFEWSDLRRAFERALKAGAPGMADDKRQRVLDQATRAALAAPVCICRAAAALDRALAANAGGINTGIRAAIVRSATWKLESEINGR